MINSFRRRILQSINNARLQTALDNNAERRLNGRAAAFASLPDWRERRVRAHHVRAEVVNHLEEYLAQFIANNQRHGVIVHRAKDSVEAIQQVLRIAKEARHNKQQNSHEGRPAPVVVAKSKSMVSEEIELNHALERADIQVVETDLGEYIVQLRKEKPSHIITPAAHLQKEQVAELFQEKLGIPYTTDIPALTATARRVLREVFFTADIGLSGVNFGVAETGAVCVVTNEGNGRMVATIPPVHISLMGIERLVPSLDDLPLFLSLLPRSATGQKLTVYTQLLHKPLPSTAGRPAQTRHLILLDNGRTGLQKSPLGEALYCIRCGACLNACPAFRELGGHAYIGRDQSIAPYPGPIGSIVSPGLLGENFIHLAQACSLCGACKDACPVDVDLPKLITRVRAGQIPDQEKTPRPANGAGLSRLTTLGLHLYTRLALHSKLYAASQKIGAFASLFYSPHSAWMRLPAFTGWGSSKDLPRFAGKSFRDVFKKYQSVEQKTGLRLQPRPDPVPEPANPQPAFPLIEQFIQELSALGGQVFQTQDPVQAILDLLHQRGIRKILLEPGTLDESLLRKAGIEFTYSPGPEPVAGVTKALCGLADTGSVLEADSALYASLLPEIHIAILKADAILPSLADAMPFVKDKAAAVFITGPSRTADIEMTLTIGVHGPKEILVFVDDSKSG